MNKIGLVFLFVFLSFQFTNAQLNKQINKSQKIAINKSPFKSSKGMIERISSQKEIRPKFLKIIDSLKNEFPKDTLMLIEVYSALCDNCPADYIKIVKGKVLISLAVDSENLWNYKRETEVLTDFFVSTDRHALKEIRQLKKDIAKNDEWLRNAKEYGTEDCFDGGHTFYTVLYPDNKILSMYMRCWTKYM